MQRSTAWLVAACQQGPWSNFQSVDPDPTRQVFISELKAGDCLGEMALIDNEPRSATAHVLEDTQALALEKERLHGALMTYPELGIGMLRALSQRLRAMTPAL